MYISKAEQKFCFRTKFEHRQNKTNLKKKIFIRCSENFIQHL